MNLLGHIKIRIIKANMCCSEKYSFWPALVAGDMAFLVPRLTETEAKLCVRWINHISAVLEDIFPIAMH